MPDCAATQIEISGELSEDLLQEFLDVIDADSGMMDWSGGVTEADLRAASAAGQTLFINNPEQPWGRFEQIEEFCAANGLTWRRADDGHYTWVGAHEAWEPSMKNGAIWCVGTNESGPCIDLATIREAHAEGKMDELLAKYEIMDRVLPPFRLVAAAVK